MYTDPFGGSTVQPSDVSFRAITLAASIVLEWPALSIADQPFARVMDVTSPNAAFTVTLPPATNVSPGMDCLVSNRGAFNVPVLNNAGTNLATLTPGQSRYFYLTDNSTAAGVWTSLLFGATSATIDASQLAGRGLQARGLLLDTAVETTFVSVSRSLADTDRATLVVWTGGGGTLTLPDNATLAKFYCEIRNGGTGTLVLAAFGGQQVNGVSSVNLLPGESVFVHMAQSTGAYTVGSKLQTTLTRATFSVTGGTRVLTLVESANVVQNYTGVLTSNQTIEFPAVVQTYYVSNNTSGAFTMTFDTAGAGATVVVPTGQNAILVCTGTDVINASTTAAGIAALLLGAGSAANPSLGLSAVNNGVYAPSTTSVGVSAGGVLSLTVAQNAVTASGAGAVVLAASSSAASAELSATAPAGFFKRLALRTAGLLRWVVESTSTAESGANAGSNLVVRRYDDAGSALGDAVTLNRATGAMTLGGALTLGGNVAAAGYKATGLGAGSADGDSLRYEQLFSQGVPLDIAASATMDIGAVRSTILRATGPGPTTITSFGTNYNGPRYITFVGAATLSYNATTLVTPDGVDLAVRPGVTVLVTPKANVSGTPDGWQVVSGNVSAANIQNNLFASGTTSGTSSAYTLTPVPPVAAYVENLEFDVEFHTANVANATINVSSLGAVAIQVYTADGILQNVPAEIPVGYRSRLTYNGSVFILRDRPSSVPAFFAEFAASTTSGTNEAVSYFTTHINRGGGFSASTGRFTASVPGVYLFTYGVQANANAGAVVVGFLRRNGLVPNYSVAALQGTTATNVRAGGSALISMGVGDYVSVFQTVSGGLPCTVDYFSGHLVA